MSPRKLTVIGLDAATLDVIEPLVAAGDLPNLKRLFGAGSRGILRSTIHPITTQAWATAFTGVNAARHGLWEFSERDADGYTLHLVNGSFRRATAVWDLLSAAGHRVGVVNVPFTWPAQRVNGFMVAGLDAASREQGMAYPEELVDRLTSRFGRLELDHIAPVTSKGVIVIDNLQQGVDQVVDITLSLCEEFDPELLIVVFMAADQAQHYGWAEWETRGSESPLAEGYRVLDRAVGKLVAAASESSDVIVLSDHGAGRSRGIVNLNSWLAEQGYLRYTNAGGYGPRALQRKILFELLERRRKIIPRGIRSFLKRRAPGLREQVFQLRFASIDWAHTKAFAFGDMGNVVVNLSGREEQGIVEPGEEYEQLCNELAGKILDLKDPRTGEGIVSAVHRRESLFDGPEIEKIPDLIIEFRDYAWTGKGNMRTQGSVFIPVTDENPWRGTTGSHRPNGMVALAGPSIRAGTDILASCEDIAPTILYLLGEAVPTDLEGRIIEEVVKPSLLAARPPTYGDAVEATPQAVASYSAEDAKLVEARLRSLGYLE